MAVYLLDTSVLVDALNNKRKRRELLAGLLIQGNGLACCTINIIEIYTGVRPHEEDATAELLNSLGFYDVTRVIAREAGRLRYDWARKGQTLSLPDATIAAVAIAHKLTLMTDNVKHFPMQNLRLYSMP